MSEASASWFRDATHPGVARTTQLLVSAPLAQWIERLTTRDSEGREFEISRRTRNPVMKTLCIEYPESIPATLNMSPDSFEEEARTALAAKLFEMGRVTSGQAATSPRYQGSPFS